MENKSGFMSLKLGEDVHETPEELASRIRDKTLTNLKSAEREALEAEYGAGNVWDYQEVGSHFEITSFMAPYCFARRKLDNVQGRLKFQHSPRYYFNFTPIN